MTDTDNPDAPTVDANKALEMMPDGTDKTFNEFQVCEWFLNFEPTIREALTSLKAHKESVGDVAKIKEQAILKLCKGEQMAAIVWTEKVIDYLSERGLLQQPAPDSSAQAPQGETGCP